MGCGCWNRTTGGAARRFSALRAAPDGDSLIASLVISSRIGKVSQSLSGSWKAAPIGHFCAIRRDAAGAPFTFDSSRGLRPLSILVVDIRLVRIAQDDAIRDAQSRGENELR